jgi:hypothetical protein
LANLELGFLSSPSVSYQAAAIATAHEKDTHDTSAHENEVSTDYREYEEYDREMFSTYQSSLLFLSLV